MEKEEKELLLKDLCARLPYGVKIDNMGEPSMLVSINNKYRIIVNPVEIDETPSFNLPKLDVLEIEDVKPYLFPLSSMTDEQKKELLSLTGYETRCEESYGFDSCGVYINIVGEYYYEDGKESIVLHPDDKGIDWFNKNHFDYRGLIPMGLSIDATNLNIY